MELKVFKSFFKYLKTHMKKCDGLITEAQNHLTSLSNKTHVLSHISRSDPENEVHTVFPELRERLLGEICSRLENDLKSLWKIENEMSASTKELKMHLCEVEVLPSPPPQPVQTDLEKVDGTAGGSSEWNPLHPSFDDLLAMAADAWRFYHDLWLNIHSRLLLFDHNDAESVSDLEKSFAENSDAKKHVKWILALTAFLTEDLEGNQ